MKLLKIVFDVNCSFGKHSFKQQDLAKCKHYEQSNFTKSAISPAFFHRFLCFIHQTLAKMSGYAAKGHAYLSLCKQ